MMKKVAAFLGIVVLTACQSVQQRPLIPGQLFPSSVINVRAPNSEGWVVLSSSSHGIAFARRGVSSNESYVAKVFQIALPEFKDRNEFVALIKQRNAENTSPERFKSIEFNYEYTEKRGYPCVRIKGVMEDTKARTSSGQDILKFQSYTLACRHPRRQGEGFAIDFSHRGSSLDTTLDAQAEAFIEGVQLTEN
jgi:hypothetical protein